MTLAVRIYLTAYGTNWPKLASSPTRLMRTHGRCLRWTWGITGPARAS